MNVLSYDFDRFGHSVINYTDMMIGTLPEGYQLVTFRIDRMPFEQMSDFSTSRQHLGKSGMAIQDRFLPFSRNYRGLTSLPSVLLPCHSPGEKMVFLANTDKQKTEQNLEW